MKKIKGFTLIEMITVLLIMVILTRVGMRYMSTLQADRAYSESCINAFYSDVSDWVYYASTSRVLSGNIIPELYILQPLPTTASTNASGFTLSYYISGNNSPINYLEKNLDDYYYCKQKTRFQIEINFNFSEIRMLPSLISVGNKNGFELYSGGARIATGAINMILVGKDKAGNIGSRQEFGQVLFDSRTGMAKMRRCSKYDETNTDKCIEWNTGKK